MCAFGQKLKYMLHIRNMRKMRAPHTSPTSGTSGPAAGRPRHAKATSGPSRTNVPPSSRTARCVASRSFSGDRAASVGK